MLAHLLAVFPPDSVQHRGNAATKPYWFMLICGVVFVLMFVLYRWWTKPVVFAGIFLLFCVFYFGSISEPNFRSIVAKPERVPIPTRVASLMIGVGRVFPGAPVIAEG